MTTAIEPSADEIELKPCPFCGGNPTLKYSPGFGWEQPPNKTMAMISCAACHLAMDYAATGKAIAAWNTRAAILAMDRRAEVVDPRHFHILVEAMSEIKATSDGDSDQPIADIVAWCLAEIKALASPPAPAVAVPEGGVTMAALRTANVARNVEWNTGSEPLSLAFRATELAGEVGEACNVLKKLERERIGIKGSRATKDQAAEELADVVICADLIAMDLGIDLGGAVVAKFNATSAKVGLSTMLAAAPEPPATRPEAEIRNNEGERIDRLKVAIEGECDGLAIDDASARVILAYVDTGDVPDDLLAATAIRALKEPGDVR